MAKAFTLKNGLILLSTEAPGGIYNSSQLKKVSALCDENTAIVKATEDQRLALFVKPENAEKVKKELQSVGLGVRNYQEGLHQPVNCIGNLCPENLQDALSTSMELQKTLSSLQLSSSLRIGINGCYRCCVPTHTLDISIIGDSRGYRISLGGKNSQIPEMACFMAESVPDSEIPRLIKEIITIYQKHASEDESLQDVMDRVGSSEFIKALHPYSQDAAGADDAFGGFTTDSEIPTDGTDVDATESDVETFEIESVDEEEFATDIAASSSDELSFDNLGTDTGELKVDDLEMDLSDLSTEVGSTDLTMEDEPTFTESSDEFAALDSDPTLSEPSADLSGLQVDIEIGDAENMEMSDDISLDTDDFSPENDIDSITPEVLADDSDLEALEMETEFEATSDDAGDGDLVEVTESKSTEELPLDESGNTLEADEVDESEADAFEEKLNASIEEEESMPLVEDENSESRMAAVRLVEAASVDELKADDADNEFGNLEIERDTADFDDDIDNIDLSPEVFDEAIDAPVKIQSSAQSSTGSGLSGIDFIDSGRIAIRFENGAQITFALSALSSVRREITVAGKAIGMAADGDGVNIDVDGMSVFFPKVAA